MEFGEWGRQEHFSGEFKFDPHQSEQSVKLEWVKIVVKMGELRDAFRNF
jgi:hypothetical protein